MISIPNHSFRWNTPDGDCTIFVLESDPIQVQIFIGKAGSTVSAWAWALAEMTNFAFESKTLDEIITKLTDISSDRATFTNNVQCRSTAEALAFSLTEFKRARIRNKQDSK